MTHLVMVETVNYCFLPCGDQQHTACEGCGVSEKCLHYLYSEFHTTPITRQKILDVHNGMRNALASGKQLIGNLKLNIAFMAYVNYDDELENLAFCWLRKCRGGRDPCPRTELYPYVQQNIYLCRKRSKFDDIVVAAMKSWRYELVSSRQLAYECSKPNIDESGEHNYGCRSNFSQILYGNNSLVGCALVRYNEEQIYYLACNYAAGYLSTFESLYEEGPPASKCTEYEPNFPYLCGKQISSSQETVEICHICVKFIISSVLYVSTKHML